MTRAARSATAPLHPPAPHALNPLRCVQVVASTLPVGCAAHFVALASPSLLLMVRSYGFQLRLDAHLATQLAALLAMMPACTHKCRAELTRPGAADLFVRTASAVGRGLHASRAFLLPLFVVRGAAPVLACLRVVGCGLWFVVTHSPSPPGACSQGATSLPQPPSGPSTPLSACIALQWMQLLVLGFGLPTLLLFRVEASSRRLLLKSLLHSNEPGLRDEARKEVARGWALPEPPPPRTSAAATAGLRPGGARLQALRIRTASALPYAAVVVLAWQGGSVAWALCVAAADAWVAVAGG